MKKTIITDLRIGIFREWPKVYNGIRLVCKRTNPTTKLRINKVECTPKKILRYNHKKQFKLF